MILLEKSYCTDPKQIIASMRTQRASSTSSSTHWSYDVFISFRGEDTRTNFTDHLRDALERKGIIVFKDEKELQKGKSIAPELSKAIEESRILIIVFSRNYASSTWCLDELVQIVQCKSENKQIVIPVFYDVDPSMVKKQTGAFQDAFTEHEKKNRKKVQNWRKALKEVANLSGFHLKDSPQTKVIRDIVNKIDRIIPKKFRIDEDLVGVSPRLQKLITLLTRTTEVYDVEMIGIYGMGGIGKTTIARAVCDLISYKFDGVCFLEHVREIFEGSNGKVQIIHQLLSQILGETYTIPNLGSGIDMIRRMLGNKKVLVVIDDVDKIEQLSYLVGKPIWFGSGSRIIITTRDKHLLMTHGVSEDKIYQAEQLNCDEALKLFSLKAFKNYHPPKNFLKLSRDVLNYAGGLPLALTILGSFLFGRTIDEWDSAIRRLGKDTERTILDCLEISYGGLKETEKKIFLDIACFFKGKHKDQVLRILDGCNLEPVIGIKVLKEKCLLTISNNTLGMHDLIQEMGQQIVKRDSHEEPGERSRLWENTDVLHVLAKNTGTKKVEGIILEEGEQLNVNVISAKAFLNLTKLRLLKVHNTQLLEGLEYLLSNELRLLDWHGCSSKSWPSSLRLDKAVEIQLQYSRIEQLWKEVQPLNKLKVINLSHSKMFKKTPDFKEIPNLDELILEGCTRLCEIHPSLLEHKKLILLNMKDCSSLTTFPSEICMGSLKKLVLSGCLKLRKFPEILGMECLTELILEGCTRLCEIHPSLLVHKKLILLNMKDCTSLTTLPSEICMGSLKKLVLSGCLKLKKFPEILESMECLRELFLDKTAIKELPLSIEFLTGIILLSLEDCKNLASLPGKIKGLKTLETLKLSGCPRIENFLENLGQMESLEVLDIRGTAAGKPLSNSLYSRFLLSLMSRSSVPMTMKLPSLSGLISLKQLDLGYRNIEVIPSDFGNLTSLERLFLEGNNFVSLPASIIRLSKLDYINLSGCKRLQSVPALPSNVMRVRVNNCITLETLSINALKPYRFSILGCDNCFKLLDYDCVSMIFSALQREQEPHPYSISKEISVSIPGSEIPKWFKYQSEGSSIEIKDGRNSKLKGYALCVILFGHKHHPGPCKSSSIYLFCNISYRYFKYRRVDQREGLTDHLWLSYIPIDDHVTPKDWFDCELKFASNNPVLEVRRCGAHPIYEEEVEELCNRFVSGDSIKLLYQDFVATAKHSLTDYDGVEQSESTNSDEDKRKPKRQKIF